MGFLSRWFGKRQTAPMTPEDTVERLPPGTGWRHTMKWVSDDDMMLLYSTDKVEVWRDGWDVPKKVNWKYMEIIMSRDNFWWRPVT